MLLSMTGAAPQPTEARSDIDIIGKRTPVFIVAPTSILRMKVEPAIGGQAAQPGEARRITANVASCRSRCGSARLS
jgi:hypothetical protein